MEQILEKSTEFGFKPFQFGRLYGHLNGDKGERSMHLEKFFVLFCKGPFVKGQVVNILLDFVGQMFSAPTTPPLRATDDMAEKKGGVGEPGWHSP